MDRYYNHILRRSNNNHRYPRNDRSLNITGVPTPTEGEEEEEEETIPISPPPPYTPSLVDPSDESSVSTPLPPPYPTQGVQFDEQGNIPTSPPPPYPPSP